MLDKAFSLSDSNSANSGQNLSRRTAMIDDRGHSGRGPDFVPRLSLWHHALGGHANDRTLYSEETDNVNVKSFKR